MLFKDKCVLLTLGLLCSLPTISFAESSEYKYVLILQSVPENFPVKDANLPVKYRSTNYKVFRTKVTLNNNKVRYRLKLGFFKSENEANEASSKIKAKYPGIWLSELSGSDRKVLSSWQQSKKKSAVKREIKKKTIMGSKKTINAKETMKRAKSAMINQKYRLAIGLYTKVVNAGKSPYHKQALEFLGVAREKNGQFIHALAEYRNYLKMYPDEEGSGRVRQRLLALNTILLKPKDKLKKSTSRFSEWQNFGNFSQFYRRDTTTSTDLINSSETQTASSTVSSVFTYLTRKRTDSLNIKTQLTASHLYYVDDPNRKERGRVNIMFVDFSDVSNNKSIRLGRQSQNRGGAPGRMDGAWMEYRFAPSFKINLVGGYPVNTTLSNSLQKNKPFYGVSFDITSENKAIDYNIYTIKQQVDSITDRNAYGTEIRYHKDKQNHFLAIDYDTYFNELNTLYFVGNWRFDNDASLVASLNYRNSPILTTSNALQGQGDLTIDTLLKSLSEDEIKKIAIDRTVRYSSATISSYFRLSNIWDFNTDVTVSRLDSSKTTLANPPIAEILGQEGSGNEFYYSFQFISNNLFKYDEINTFQLSRIDSKTYKKVRYLLSSSFKYSDKWRFRPKLIYEERKNNTGSILKRLIPGIRIDYKTRKNLKWEFDVSKGTSDEKSTLLTPVDIHQDDLNISAGFIWDF